MERLARSAALACALALALPAVALGSDALPEPQRRNQVAFLSGGVGDREQAAIREQLDDYKLAVTLVRPDGAYLAHVHLVIEDANGEELVETTTRGPVFLADLPAGKYTIRADLPGHQMEKRVVDVPEEGNVRMYVALPERAE